ncbi:MAG: metallophosphoesterase [Proteobacteria bacterium]|nr:metallophosphoesterase [Pseudomonadota bacterium]
MAVAKTIKSKAWYAALFFAFCFFALLGFELWEDGADERENYYVDQLLSNPPQNLNIKAITRLQEVLKGKDAFRFAVLGDNRYNFGQLKKVLTAAAKDKPDFIIHTGDSTSSSKYHQYMKLLASIEGFDIPMIFILGNHDVNNRGVTCFLHIFGPSNFCFDINSYRFIFTDNALENTDPEFARLPDDGHKTYSADRGIDNGKMRDLEKLLQGSAHNFIIMHLPPPVEPFRFHSFDKNGEHFVTLMQRYSSRISRVLCGHIHGYGDVESNGVRYVVTGGAGAHLVSTKEGITSKYNYVMVSVTGETVTHTVHFVD